MLFGDERLPQRFWDKVFPEPNTGCWLWSGALGGIGYPKVYRSDLKKPVHGHRWVLEVATDDVGDVARHQCGQTTCVNPAHLLWGSASDNNYDTVRQGNHSRSVRTHCAKGHPYDELNTWHRPDGRRWCHICRKASQRERNRRYQSKKRGLREGNSMG